MVQISASIFAANFMSLKTEIDAVSSADRLHLDVMDGHFVPNISFGTPVIETIQERASHPLDVHLMSTEPSMHVDRLVDCDINSLSFHFEATNDIRPLLDTIEGHGITPGVAISPRTDVNSLEPLLDDIPRVVVMGVSPGFSGQKFMPDALTKITKLGTNSSLTVEIDGGITERWATRSIDAGADIVVSGSTIFKSTDRGDTIQSLRGGTTPPQNK